MPIKIIGRRGKIHFSLDYEICEKEDKYSLLIKDSPAFLITGDTQEGTIKTADDYLVHKLNNFFHTLVYVENENEQIEFDVSFCDEDTKLLGCEVKIKGTYD